MIAIAQRARPFKRPSNFLLPNKHQLLFGVKERDLLEFSTLLCHASSYYFFARIDGTCRCFESHWTFIVQLIHASIEIKQKVHLALCAWNWSEQIIVVYSPLENMILCSSTKTGIMLRQPNAKVMERGKRRIKNMEGKRRKRIDSTSDSILSIVLIWIENKTCISKALPSINRWE